MIRKFSISKFIPHYYPLLVLILVIFLSSLMDLITKKFLLNYVTGEIFFFRSVIGVILLLIITTIKGYPSDCIPRRPIQCIILGFVQSISGFLFFFSYKFLLLSEVYAISFLAPLMMATMSWPMLRQSVGRWQWLAILIGFIGVMMMLQPAAVRLSGIGMAAAAAATFLYALDAILVVRVGQANTTIAIAFSTHMAMLPMSLLSVQAGWVWPHPFEFGLLLLVGVMSLVAVAGFTHAFRLAPVAILAPFEYTSMIWAVLFDYMFWEHQPTLAFFVGGVLVAGSIVASIRAAD